MEISTFLLILLALLLILTAAIMIKKAKKKPAIKNGWVFGYDPGGNGDHGVAAIKVDSGRVAECICHTFDTAQEVLDWINEDKRPMLAIGVDTLTYWSLGKSGDREADCWLRDEYNDVEKHVLSSNELGGAMSVNGMAVLIKVREKHPCVPITETHPKVLYYALTDCEHKHDYAQEKVRMDEYLSTWLKCDVPPEAIKTEHEWDALISAYATLQGLRGCWTQDLAADIHNDPSTVWPCGCVHYWWPEKIT